jgi:uncharacterized protein
VALTLFLDTSALVKLYIEETDTPIVQEAVSKAKKLVVASLTLPESASVFGRAALRGLITLQESHDIWAALLSNWKSFGKIALEESLAKEAALLAKSKNLRGADAVQLASAAWISRQQKGVKFLAFDKQLNQAAQTLLRLYP